MFLPTNSTPIPNNKLYKCTNDIYINIYFIYYIIIQYAIEVTLHLIINHDY